MDDDDPEDMNFTDNQERQADLNVTYDEGDNYLKEFIAKNQDFYTETIGKNFYLKNRGH